MDRNLHSFSHFGTEFFLFIFKYTHNLLKLHKIEMKFFKGNSV